MKKKHFKKNLILLRKIIIFPRQDFLKIRFFRFYFFLIINFILYGFSNCLLSSTSPEFEQIKINGKVKNLSSELEKLEGLDIVLLKYVLNQNGEVIPIGPQKRTKTKSNGKFKFDNVIPDLKAGFQLGTRFKGNLYSSKIFFMKKGETSIEMNIIIPKISNETERLEVSKVSILIEAELGKVLVTEFLLFSNPSQHRINTGNKPIEYRLPKAIQNFRLLSGKTNNSIKYSFLNDLLKIEHIFNTGDTQIVYQYNLPALFGSLEIDRSFDHNLGIVGVFTPVNLLEIKSNMLVFSGKKKFNNTDFLSWESQATYSNRIKIKINNVPQTSKQYFIISIALIILFFCTLILFYKKRLNKINQ